MNANLDGSGNKFHIIYDSQSDANHLFLKSSAVSDSFMDSAWHQFVWTYDGSTPDVESGTKVYVDKVLQTMIGHSGSVSNPPGPFNAINIPFTMGGADTAIAFQGKIDEVKVYDVDLTLLEITQNFELHIP